MSRDPYPPPPAGAQPPYLHREYGSTVKRSPSRALLPLRQTLSEITGPRFRGETELVDLTRQVGSSRTADGR